MQAADFFLVFTRPLDQAGIRYMVSGSVASIVYGEPRLTNDVDMVIVLNDSQIRQLAALFPPNRIYCPPPEIVAAETARDAASKASSEKEMELKLAEQTIKSEEKSLESLEERLRTLRNDGKTQEERRTELTTLALSWDAAKARVKEYERSLRCRLGVLAP